MPPKKAQSLYQSVSHLKEIFSEADKARFEELITDCNQKIAGLRRTVNRHEIHNETLQKAYDKLDEDRGDIIEYLKKTLKLINEENIELKVKITSLDELRIIEIAQFKVIVNELQTNFTKMQGQLTSENKLQAGKLNTLEEIRAVKEDLMKKFEKQGHAFEEQAKKYKRIIYYTEKQLVIEKDKVKKEMEERIVQLAQEFQDASEMRIAASTHKVIRESIALNNQLDGLLITQAKLADQNEKCREDEGAARCAMEVAEEERAAAVNKSNMQLKHINRVTAEFENFRKQKAIYDKNQVDTEKMHAEIHRLSKTNEKLLLKVRVLEQNLQSTLDDQNKSVVQKAKLLKECETFKNILKESTFAVQAALKMDHWTTLDPSRKIIDRKMVFLRILGVINQYRDPTQAESKESLISLSDIYEKGNLGFDEKPVPSTKSQALFEPASGIKTASVISFENKRSDISISSLLSPSKEDIKTMSSIELVAVDEDISESLASFISRSLHSSYSSNAVESEGSGGDMQKSLMQDLALSQLSTKKLSGPDSTSRLSTSQKSIIYGKGGPDDIEGEHRKTVPEEDESEHVQD